MLRTLAAFSLAMAVASPPSSTAWAQRPTTRVSLAVGGSFVNFSDVGGRMGAGVGQVAITRHSSGGYGVELAGFGVAPWGAVSVQPTCLPDSSCDTRSTPSLLTGATLSPTARLGSSGLWVAGGACLLMAAGGEGLRRRTSLAGTLSLRWMPPRDRRIVPTVGVRLVRLARNVAGARLLVLPTAGVAF